MVYVVKKYLYPFTKKCSISLDFVIRDQYYCCHDCYLGEKMTGDGYPYKFVNLHDNEVYFCFFQFDDTIKEILVEFLQIIVGEMFSSSQDYGAKIMYARQILPQETKIKDVFQTKKDNNVIFNIRTQIKTRSKKRIKPSQEFQGKSIIPIQSALNNYDRLKMSDDNISSSNTIPGK